MEITEQSSTIKRQKLSDGKQEVDRLSALPDDLVCRILSFLPTYISVSTSVLAQRWRLVWAHVPVLDFDSEDHNIINRVMMRHKAQRLNTCTLFIDDCNNFELESWITTLIDRNVRQLNILLDHHLMLPRCLFTCKTLVDLALTCCANIPMAWAIYLPALTKLRLDKVKYVSDESLPRLLSCCPVLEELNIWREDEDNMFCCYIPSPTLNTLTLDHMAIEYYDEKGYQLKLHTPALRYLRLHDSLSENPTAGALASLTEAFVTFNSTVTLAYSRSVLEFVSRLYNVKCLYITSFGLEVCVPDSEFSAWTIKFHNLTKLELRTDCHFISRFIENADNLEVLCYQQSNNDLSCWMEPKQVPACLASHLQIVRIFYFGCNKEQEFNMVRYFLRNA
ncbi:F-box/FBD/LRR-repeat protein at3g52680 [Phtheirospermum japonicum]|uniref:F-box/FBD/LRR-repeat protein at3g52680 n=1 Tax=Phtheirospermum japonicum TaxID=374723 RepID=A0A830D5E7_9LAMI|nr:F-box/FBD/LRR-repeat protein at3g52680 [Phtheirospermum japonicum]